MTFHIQVKSPTGDWQMLDTFDTLPPSEMRSMVKSANAIQQMSCGNRPPYEYRVIDLAAWDCYINDKFVIRKNTERAANMWLRKNSEPGNSWRRVEL